LQDATRLATGGQDKKLRIFDLGRPEGGAAATFELPDKVRKVVWLPDGRRVVVGTDDGFVRLYDAASGAVVVQKDLGSGGVMDVELSNDASVLTVAAGATVAVLATDSLETRHKHTLPTVVEGASLHPVHKRHFIAGGTDVWVRMFDVVTGAELVCHKGHHGTVHCVRFAPGGDLYASGADDATIRLWKYEEAGPAGAKGGAGGP
jgi:serine-threonine kinase receptor-associated protein